VPVLSPHAAEIDSILTITLKEAEALLPLGAIRVRLFTDPAGTIPEIGVGGFTPSAEEIRLWIDAARADTTEIVSEWLRLVLLHELHHAARTGTVGYGGTVFAAVVSEGLADHFAVEVTGKAPPPWAVALTGQELADWVAAVLAAPSGAYSHPRWFFGTDTSVPRWAGYAVGFELIRVALAASPGATAAGWADAEASQFRP